MQEAKPDLRVLVLNDGFKGNLNQSLGIAEAFHTADIRFLDVPSKRSLLFSPFKNREISSGKQTSFFTMRFKIMEVRKVFLEMPVKRRKLYLGGKV
ncbi:MAG: hypothetical protein ACOX1Z_05245 [Candidatus Ratteibacteria bacterium]